MSLSLVFVSTSFEQRNFRTPNNLLTYKFIGVLLRKHPLQNYLLVNLLFGLHKCECGLSSFRWSCVWFWSFNRRFLSLNRLRSIALWLGNLHTVSPTERNVSHTGLWNSLMRRAESSLRGKMAGYAKNEQDRVHAGPCVRYKQGQKALRVSTATNMWC